MTVYWFESTGCYWNNSSCNWYPSLIQADVADGVSLGDSNQEYLVEVLSDGVRLSDTLVEIYRARPCILDGIVLSDTSNTKVQYFIELSDGLTLSDTSTGYRKFFLNLADGINFSDSVQEYLIELLQDGIILSDEIFRKKMKKEVGLDLFTRVVRMFDYRCNPSYFNDKYYTIPSDKEKTIAIIDYDKMMDVNYWKPTGN